MSVESKRPRRPQRKSALDKVSFSQSLSKADTFRYSIPNPKFCEDMQMKPLNGLLLPWWFNYCEDLKEKNLKGRPEGHVDLSQQRAVLNQLQRYKKAQKIKNTVLRSLKELVENK